MENTTWDSDSEGTLVSALAGSGLGDSFAKAWPEIERRKAESAANINKYIDPQPSDIVAEIGAGVGLVTKAVSERVAKALSLDVSESFQKVARKIATSENVEFHLIKPGDLSCLRGTGVNKIFSEGCFIHLNLFDISLYASQAFEILPYNGLLAFDISNADRHQLWNETPWQEHLAHFSKSRSSIWQMQAWHSPRTVCDLLAHEGFFVEAIYNPMWMYSWIVARKR